MTSQGIVKSSFSLAVITLSTESKEIGTEKGLTVFGNKHFSCS